MNSAIAAPSIQMGFVLAEVVLAAGICTIMLMDAFSRKRAPKESFGVTALVLLGASILTVGGFGQSGVGMGGMIVFDPLRSVMSLSILLSALFASAIGFRSIEVRKQRGAEFYMLLLSSALGMLLMVASANFVMLFLALELMSIPIYALSGYDRRDVRSGESALKYLILGSAASAILLYGIALNYGVTGSLNIDQAMRGVSGDSMAVIAMILIWVGVLFKIAVVPFHLWVPDVYEGAPTAVTAFMSTAVKIAMFATVFRLWIAPVSADPTPWLPMLQALAVVTMIAGNVLALVQDRIKRMLAYSSIAHGGYMMAALVAVNMSSVAAIQFYLYAYVLMNMGAFALLIAFGRDGRDAETYSDLDGLAYEHPYLAAGMTIFMLSLAGVPPTVGFTGKLFLFNAIVEAGLIPLAVIGVLASAIGVFVYLRAVVHLYMRPSTDAEARPVVSVAVGEGLSATVLRVTVGILVVAVLYLGIRPVGILRVAEQAAEQLIAK